jgi:hypothetical protein
LWQLLFHNYFPRTIERDCLVLNLPAVEILVLRNFPAMKIELQTKNLELLSIKGDVQVEIKESKANLQRKNVELIQSYFWKENYLKNQYV